MIVATQSSYAMLLKTLRNTIKAHDAVTGELSDHAIEHEARLQASRENARQQDAIKSGIAAANQTV